MNAEQKPQKQVMAGCSQFAADLVVALGGPKHTTRLDLTLDAQEMISAKVTYFPELSADVVALVKDYVLIERSVAIEKGLI